MKRLYFFIALLAAVNISFGQLIINEVLYDPSNNGLDGDANGDGVYGQNDDSFIEIYNNGSMPFDISGYEIWDDTTSGGSIEFTFPANTLIPAGEVAVVFGGDTNSGSFGTALVFNAINGLSFNNSGEVIGVKDTNGNWALVFDSDALSNNPNESYTRFPDVTGTFLQHGDTTSVLFSPGTKVDGSAFNPTAPPPPAVTNLIVNEVLYDPSNSGLDGDANGDGVYDQNDDSFIEIYNADSANSFDISGYEIWDDTASGGTVQYTFPSGTIIPAQEVVVVFGGDTNSGNFGSAVVLNANNGFSFNNSGEVIGVKDTNGNWTLVFDSDALSNNPNESYTRFPDVTGTFLQHGDTTSVLFSPGTKVDGSAFNPTAPPPPAVTNLIVNEVLYDPSNSGLDGDANGDGVYDQDDDSFIEIYNADSANSFDISGYEIWDDTTSGGTMQYTFPSGSIIPAKEVVVVFGGTTSMGNFGSALVLNAGTGLNFNNSGEVIGLKDTNGNWALTFDSDALSNNPNESYTRFPDVTGTFLQHGDTTSVLFSPGTKVDGSAFNPTAPPPPAVTNLIVNEVLYDPSNSGLDGDANGDGVYDQNDDSFIEIYNADSANSFNIGGYEIWDDTASGGTVQYTFPNGTLIPAKEVVVVFGGDTNSGNFGSALVLNANTGLDFNNSGEVIGLKDPSGNWVIQFDSDALSINPNESYTRFPDVTGTFLQHSDTTSVLFSPGTKVDGSAFNPSAPPPPPLAPGTLIINEVLYDPSNSGLDGDANGDGVYVQDDDSFIEIYNADSTNSIDISGYEIWDDTASGGTVQYTFPSGTTIPSKEVVVVFGGDTNVGSFGTAVVLNANTGLNFNNSGEVIGVKDNNGDWALIFDSDALSNNPNESYTRNPDVVGSFEQHNDNTPVLFSPGTKVDGTSFRPNVGLAENISTLELAIYPNPVQNRLYIQSDYQLERIEVFRMDGTKVLEARNAGSTVDVTTLARGVYLLKVSNQAKVKTIRFIKQ